jgi:hypothetical protein
LTAILSAEPNLSSIVAFNSSYNSGMNGNVAPSASSLGKRPADVDDGSYGSHKRLRFNEGELDRSISLQLTGDEAVHNQIHARMFEGTEPAMNDINENNNADDQEEDEEHINALASELDSQLYSLPDKYSYLLDASEDMKVHSLPVLDNLVGPHPCLQFSCGVHWLMGNVTIRQLRF